MQFKAASAGIANLEQVYHCPVSRDEGNQERRSIPSLLCFKVNFASARAFGRKLPNLAAVLLLSIRNRCFFGSLGHLLRAPNGSYLPGDQHFIGSGECCLLAPVAYPLVMQRRDLLPSGFVAKT